MEKIMGRTENNMKEYIINSCSGAVIDVSAGKTVTVVDLDSG